MASPFPGMNPLLEDPAFWSAVHNRLIVAIADDLVDHLSEKYRVEIEKRTYFSNDDESLLVGIPDVSVVTGRAEATPSMAQSSLSVLPEKVTVPILEEVTERYLEIREVATGTVVTVLEILSPKNKRAGEGRLAYERKRHQVLASRPFQKFTSATVPGFEGDLTRIVAERNPAGLRQFLSEMNHKDRAITCRSPPVFSHPLNRQFNRT
jgi:hypothetical protein